MKIKRAVCLIISFLLIFSYAWADDGKISGDPSYKTVLESEDASKLNEAKILLGTGNGFELDKNVTRAEAAALMLRIYPGTLGALGAMKPEFSDIDGHWAYKEICTAKKLGIIHGVTSETFEPERSVTGKEMAKMLLCVLGYDGATTENIENYAKDTFDLCTDITKRLSASDEFAKRGECAVMICDIMNLKAKDGEVFYKKLAQINSDIDYEKIFSENKDDNGGIKQTGFEDKINSYIPKNENYMFSPLSIKTALMMLANGADGETQSQILNAFGVENLNDYNGKIKNLIKDYAAFDALKVNISNSVWLNKDNVNASFGKDFENVIKDSFNGESKVTDNKNAVNEINSWVSDKTNGKIKRITDNPDFAAALINAVYFKGSWLNEFDERKTKKDDFYDISGSKTSIDFMNRTGYYNYVDDGKVKIIELPYKNFVDKTDENGNYTGTEKSNLNFSMYVMSQNDGKLCENPAEILNSAYLMNTKPKNTYVSLSMPKFKIEFTSSLSTILKNLGITDAFAPAKSDLSKMLDLGSEKAYVTDAVHKTYIDVNEKDTEAAAVTGIFVKATAAMPDPIPVEVKFDKPFTFIIRDNTNGEILFMGSYVIGK